MFNLEAAATFVAGGFAKAGPVVTGASAVFGAAIAGYLSLGGPIPATRDYVDGAIRPLQVDSLTTRRSVLTLTRHFLGSEETALRKAIEGLPEGSVQREALERRLRELGEARVANTREDDEARTRLEAMKR